MTVHQFPENFAWTVREALQQVGDFGSMQVEQQVTDLVCGTGVERLREVLETAFGRVGDGGFGHCCVLSVPPGNRPVSGAERSVAA